MPKKIAFRRNNGLNYTENEEKHFPYSYDKEEKGNKDKDTLIPKNDGKDLICSP